jgi:small-conductance mechanosensitive channel
MASPPPFRLRGIRSFESALRAGLAVLIVMVQVLGADHLVLAQAAPAPSAQPSTEPKDLDPATVRESRDKVQAHLNALGPGAAAGQMPTDATQEELQEQRSLLEQILRAHDEQLSDLQRLAEARQRLADVTRSSSEWTGFPDPPPYSIFLADQLWDAAYAHKLAIEGLQSQLDLLTLRSERGRQALAAAEEQLRQASERLEAATDSAHASRERWLRDLAALRRQAASVTVQSAELSKQRVEAELEDTRARLAFEQRRLDTAAPQVEFGEEDLNKVRARVADQRLRLEEELEQILRERRKEAEKAQDADRRLAALRAKRPAGAKDTPAIARAQAALDVVRARLDTLVVRGDLLRQTLDMVEGERQLWERRYAIRQSTEPGTAREAYAHSAPLFHNLQAARDYLRQQAGIVSGQISEIETRLRHATGARDRAAIEGLLATFQARHAAYSRALRRVDEAVRFMERWRAEFKERQQELPWSAHVAEWLDRATAMVAKTWNFEVFSAEDTIEVDDKKITGRRSVTVGKILAAIGIMIVGYVVCLYLARLIGRLAAARLGLAPDVANLVRQWTQAVLITLLIIVSFMSVKIPLTIFAFLGGAFAIGVGFGAQNLLKNVISGILVLIERPLRVGDLIEVDNVRGRVTSIGLRSSTVRDAKGMETLIPNSSFLERHLTNWTYSSSISRFSLRLGAPYGATSQQIMELLSALASSHPHVLKTPEPQVLLEDFGSQARIFTLNYWLEIRPDVDPNAVASELRFAIEQKFLEAGLKVLPAA